MKINSSSLLFTLESRRNRRPNTGMSPKKGTLSTPVFLYTLITVSILALLIYRIYNMSNQTLFYPVISDGSIKISETKYSWATLMYILGGNIVIWMLIHFIAKAGFESVSWIVVLISLTYQMSCLMVSEVEKMYF